MPKANQILKGLKKLKATGLSAEWRLLKQEKVFKGTAKINGENFEEYCDFLSKLLSDSGSESKSVKDKIKKYTGSSKGPGIIAPQIKLLSPKLAIIANSVQEDDEAPEFEARLEKLKTSIKQVSGTPAGDGAKLKASEASLFARKENFEQANTLLAEAEVLLEEMDDEGEDDGEPLVSPQKIKLFMKKAKNNPHPFACGIGSDGFIFTMNKVNKKPKALANNMKRDAGTPKVSFGLLTLEGKTLVLDLHRKPLPKMARSMKFWLKENKPLPAQKVRLMENGEEIPLTAEELAEEITEYEPLVLKALKSGAGDSQKINAIWAFANEKAGAGNYGSTMKALSALDKLLAEATGSKGESEASDTIPEAPPVTDSNSADQLSARIKGLIPQIKKAVKTSAGNDAKLKVSEAGVFARKKDFDQANALLDEAEQLLSQPSGGSPEATKWKAYQEALSGLFAKAMVFNPDNRSQLEAAWAMATEKAEGGDYATALKIAAKLKPALDAVVNSGAVTTDTEKTESEKQSAKSESTTADEVDQAASVKDAIDGWQSAQRDMATNLKAVEKTIAAADHPSAAEALIELKAVRSQLNGTPDTMQKVLETEKYLQQDDVVEDVCDLAQDIRTPLLAAIAQLKAVL